MNAESMKGTIINLCVSLIMVVIVSILRIPWRWTYLILYAYVLFSMGLCVIRASELYDTALDLPVLHKIDQDPFGHRILSDPAFRNILILSVEVVIHSIYGLLNLFMGITQHSLWHASVSVYYILLSFIRAYLVYSYRKAVRQPSYVRNRKIELKAYCVTGLFLFFLNIAISLMTGHMVVTNPLFGYTKLSIISSAVFTIYIFNLALYNIIHYRKMESPILTASKNINMAAALLAIYNFQIILIKILHMDNATMRWINGTTGTIINIYLLYLSFHMILRGYRKTKRLTVQYGSRQEPQ
ncbi:MAG: hypothetical protein J6D36_09135 [Erysipelotrichaceae bacterium]|nr:hypothetical protein [Erysipelotrichaceae bacterium]